MIVFSIGLVTINGRKPIVLGGYLSRSVIDIFYTFIHSSCHCSHSDVLFAFLSLSPLCSRLSKQLVENVIKPSEKIYGETLFDPIPNLN